MLGSEHHYYEKKYDLEFAGEKLKGSVITNTLPQLRYYDWGAWTASRTGKSIVYEHQEAFAGSPGPVTTNLSLEAFGQVNRIEQLFTNAAGDPSASAKDISVRVLTAPSNTRYLKLQNILADTMDSELLNLGDEYKYPIGTVLKFVYENYTDTDVFKIIVQVDEL